MAIVNRFVAASSWQGTEEAGKSKVGVNPAMPATQFKAEPVSSDDDECGLQKIENQS